jgi:hypothetical protein
VRGRRENATANVLLLIELDSSAASITINLQLWSSRWPVVLHSHDGESIETHHGNGPAHSEKWGYEVQISLCSTLPVLRYPSAACNRIMASLRSIFVAFVQEEPSERRLKRERE